MNNNTPNIQLSGQELDVILSALDVSINQKHIALENVLACIADRMAKSPANGQRHLIGKAACIADKLNYYREENVRCPTLPVGQLLLIDLGGEEVEVNFMGINSDVTGSTAIVRREDTKEIIELEVAQLVECVL